MKNFLKYLAVGSIIGIVTALVICYSVWSIHSVHRLMWFFIVFLSALFVSRYMSEPDWIECENKQGRTGHDKVEMRQMTLGEKFGVMLRTIVGIGILSALVWTIGYGVACLFGWQPDFWEMYLLYGVLTGVVIWLIFVVGSSVWFYFYDLIHNRADIRKKTKLILLKIIAAIFGLVIAGVILYFLFPVVIKS